MSSGDENTDEGWRPITPEHYALYEQAMARARALFDDERDDVAAVADDSFRMADEALALWGTIDTLKRIAEQQKVENALLRRGIEDAIHALTHLMKQSGKPDQSEIVSRVVQIVVPRLHQVLADENPYDETDAKACNLDDLRTEPE
jgi:acyl-CoA reductase-like NAD-dependent aldehyde dehydrogenase